MMSILRAFIGNIVDRYRMRVARRWFARHGLDWDEFLRNGIPASRLEATGDAFGIDLARWARHEAETAKVASEGLENGFENG